MSVSDQEREIRRANAKADPPENLKLRRGMLVRIHEEPGIWQAMDQAPTPPGAWWLQPWDDAARAADPDREWGAYRKATYRTLKSANARS
jgi:hypothetical protein